MSASQDSTVSTRRAATRERLIKAAIVVFAQQGIRGASVEHICEEAGFTRGAFYSNFESKNELITALLEWYNNEMRASFLRTLDDARNWDSWEDSSPEATISEAANMFVSLKPSSPDLVLTLADLKLEAARSAAVREAMQKVTVPMREGWRDLLEAACQEVGLNFVASATETFDKFEAVYEHLCLEAVIAGEPANSPEIGRQMADLLRALTTAA